MVENFARFSHLLDANFDAFHGSFASILRLMDVFGEFLYVTKTFVIFRIIYSAFIKLHKFIMSTIIGIDFSQQNNINNNIIDIKDYKNFQNNKQQKKISMILILLGFTCLSGPMLIVRLWNAYKKRQNIKNINNQQENLDNIWKKEEMKNEKEISKMVKALYDFKGENETDLSFHQNDIIFVLDKPFPEWWFGELMNGKKGLFPANFVEFIEEK